MEGQKQKPSPGTPDMSMPIPIASPRSDGFQVGDELTMYGQTVKIMGTRPDGSPIVTLPTSHIGTGEEKPVGTPTKPITQTKPTIHRGRWIQNRLLGLYNDPIYKNASPEVKKYYKERAYDKWVVPYFKHIGMSPESKEQFVSGSPEHESGLKQVYNWLTYSGSKYAKQREVRQERQNKVMLAASERSSKVLAGISNTLNWISQKVIDSRTEAPAEVGIAASPDQHVVTTGIPQRREQVSSVFKRSEDYYTKQAQHIDDILSDTHQKDLSTTLTDIATQGVFFEALGGAKASEAFKVLNPKTASLAVKAAKTAWNGAVTGLFWAPTTGGQVDDTVGNVAGFALADMGLKGASGAFFKVFGKYFGHEFVNKTLEETATDLASGKGVTIPKQSEFNKVNGLTPIHVPPERKFIRSGEKTPPQPPVKTVQELERAEGKTSQVNVNLQTAKAGMARILNQAAQKIEGGEEKGAFRRLSPRRQKALLVRLSMLSQTTKDFDLSAEVKEEHLHEEEAKMDNVVPAAPKIRAQVDGLIKQNGLDPAKAKLGATLPRHQTTIESPIKDISARISFLRNQIKAAEKDDAIMSEISTLREAMRQEKMLLDKVRILRSVKNLQKSLKESK